jgi:hypothetical protein
MRMLRTWIIVVGLVPGLAAAQDPSVAEWPLDSGSKVRITSPAFGLYPRVGMLVSTAADTLFVRHSKKDSTLAIAVPNIARLEVARGTHTRKAKGALIGFLIGGLAGAAIGSASYKPTTCGGDGFCFDFGPEFGVAVLGVVGAGVGALIGTIAGSSPTDTWVRVSVPRN